MKSALSRRVFRHILHSQPLSHLQCLRAKKPPTLRALSKSSSRHFFNFGLGAPKLKRELKPENVDEGWKTMVKLVDYMNQRVRPPPRVEVLDAFTNFLKSRVARTSKMTDVQVEYALTTYRHLIDTANEGSSGLPTSALFDVLRALATKHAVKGGDDGKRVEMAQLAWGELLIRKDQFAQEMEGRKFEDEVPHLYFRILSYHGQPQESTEYMLKLLHAEDNDQLRKNASLWRYALRSAARTQDAKQLERVLDARQTNHIPYTDIDQHAIIQVYIEEGDLDAVKRWYSYPVEAQTTDTSVLPRSAHYVFWMCLEHDDLQFAKTIVQSVLDSPVERLVKMRRDRKLIFAFAATSHKSPEEIQHMFDAMERRCEEHGAEWVLKMPTINALIRVATINNDSYMAERYLTLGYDNGCDPDGDTYMLMLDYRLKHGDIPGGRKAYDQLQKFVVEDEDQMVACTNKLVLAMYQKAYDFSAIMELASDLIDRKAPFTPPVVAALSSMYLQRNELHDAIDLIRTHAPQFSTNQRSLLHTDILRFCLSSEVDAQQTWDSYVILHELFDIETTREIREHVMTKLFKNRRPDLAIHVFGHLRKSPHSHRRPTLQSYVMCFEGLAATGADEEIVAIIHNMLKLDTEVDPDTRLKNAMMMAYIRADDARTALEFWEDIKVSQEGPTYNSIRIAFWAAQKHHAGLSTASDLWQKLADMGVEMTPGIYLSYACTLAAHDQYDQVFELFENMSKSFPSSSVSLPDPNALAVLFNASHPLGRIDVQEWAKAKFPEAWEAMESIPNRGENPYTEQDYYDVDTGIRP